MESMIRESFPVGPLQCNCTLLGDESSGEAIVVDPGDEIGEVLTRLARHRLKLKQIIVTHAHIDHVGGAAQLRKATGAPVYLNEQDLSLLGKMEMQAAWLGVPTPETVSPDVLAVEGLAVGLGGIAGEVLHTPGHTQGSICLHFANENLLLAGDTLFAGSIGRTDLPGGDGRQIMLSLRDRILTLPETTLVVPGHGPETTIAVERETNPFLKGLR
jgi:glyoxylase-like metal-dependent hydrolase (beta-lactamase superfamily II)